MDIVNAIMLSLMLFCSVFGLFFVVIALMGMFKRAQHYKRCKPQKRIAAVIAARNEEGVIAALVSSLLAQNYPRELMEVYVVPNNCTDNTEQAARAAGARILHCNKPVHAKGEAVSCAIDTLLTLPQNYDAFVIFDADNVIDSNYFQVVNDALCAGARVAQGYRDSKNYGDAWISGCSSLFYWGMNRAYNRARIAIGMSAALNGTGIMVSADIMREMGWHTQSLTEDLEFTAQCALRGEKIHFLNDAIAYDEQPLTLRDSFKQRRRWSAGTMQCLRRYGKRLFQKAFHGRSLQALDMAILFTGPVIQLVCMIPGVYFAACTIIGSVGNMAALMPWMLGLAVSGVAGIIGSALLGILVACMEKKPLRPLASAFAMMWLFLLSWVPANLMCLFTKPPKWEQISHSRNMSVSEVEANAEYQAELARERAREREAGKVIKKNVKENEKFAN